MKLKQLVIIWISILSMLAWGQSLQFGAPQGARKAEGKPIDEIALVVNGEAITRKVLQAEMQAERLSLPPNIPLKGAALEKQLLERVIINHILKQMKERANITVSDDELNAALNHIAQQNRLSTKALFAQVKKRTGMNEARYRAQIRRQVEEDHLKQLLLEGSIHITDAQINDQIAQISRQAGSKLHIQDMLIPLPAGTPETRAEKVDQLIATVANELRQTGQDLRASAARIPEARFQDFGEVNLGEIPPQFANVLANTPVGEVADTPVINADGMHFLKVASSTGNAGGYQVEEAKVAHILLKTGGGRDAQNQKARAERLYQRLLQGADFASLARQYSEDPQSAAQGGSLGWVSPENMVSEFAQAMQSQQIGQIYPPIKTPYGYHLVIVYDRKKTDKSEEVLRQKIRDSLYARAVEDAWEQQLRALREEAYVDIRY